MPQIHHVICLFYAVTNACFVPINWVLDIPAVPHPLAPAAPAARRPPPAPFVPPLRLFFLHRRMVFICTENSYIVPRTVIYAADVVPAAAGQDVVPAAIAQDEAGPPAAAQDTGGLNCQKKVWYVNFLCHFYFWCHLKGSTPAYPHKKNN